MTLSRTIKSLCSVCCYCLLACLISINAYAQIAIELKQNTSTLLYEQPIRYSQVLKNAYEQLNYSPYILGTALIDLSKQSTIDAKKQNILNALSDINTPSSKRIAVQLNAMKFAFRETVEADPSKVKVNQSLDPMIKRNYLLSLPKRPDHIMIISPFMEETVKAKLKENSDLNSYLANLPNEHNIDAVWIIQANQDVYQATDIQWKDKPYFLSPGAIVFTGLTNLPDRYRDLNANIAQFLAFNVDL